MLNLKATEAYPVIRKAYDEKKLQAQVMPFGEEGTLPECRYYDPENDCRCAIGVLIPEGHPIATDYNESRVGILVNTQVLRVDDLEWFCNLQAAHDRWLLFGSRGPEFEAKFVEVLERINPVKPEQGDHDADDHES